jgi:hypothetical protein
VTIRETEAIEFLRSRVGDEGYIVIGQVPDATGAGQRRTIDALMVQCWPSRGLSLTAIEYKASVSDFRRELKQPEKAEMIAQHCDAVVVLAPKDVVPIAELPPSWGLWEIHKTEKQCRLLRTVAPQITPRATFSVPISFLVAVLRAREGYNADAAKLEAMRQKDRAEHQQRVDDAVKYRTRELLRRMESVEEFEAASGLKISKGWALGQLGEGLARFLKDPDAYKNTLQRQREQLRNLVKAIDDALPDESENAEGPPA